MPHPTRSFVESVSCHPVTLASIKRSGELQVHRYWDPDFVHVETRRERSSAEQLRTTLRISRRAADAERCAARSIPFRWRRFLVDRGALMQQLAGDPSRRSRSGFPSRNTTKRIMPASCRAPGNRSSRIPVTPRVLEILPEAGLALRRTVCRQFGDSDLVRFAN